MTRKQAVNDIDERTLMLLGSRRAKVPCTDYTLRPNSPKLAPALTNNAKRKLRLLFESTL